MWLLLPVLILAVIADLWKRKIPNPLIVGGLLTGAACQWSQNGPLGLAVFVPGALLPLIVLGSLHYFRMLGAGDIKLFMVAGGFLGTENVVRCMVYSLTAAACISAAILLKHRIFRRRLRYFLQYLHDRTVTKTWKPYIVPGENRAYLHFSVPILIGCVLVMGGIS